MKTPTVWVVVCALLTLGSAHTYAAEPSDTSNDHETSDKQEDDRETADDHDTTNEETTETTQTQEADEEIGPYGAGFERVKDVTSQFDLEIGGHVKLDAIYDSQQLDSDLPFFALPTRVVDASGASGPTLVNNPKDATSSFNLAARELLLHLSVATPDYGAWSAGAYIEFNFLGFLEGANAGAPTPILRHGYATLSNSETGTEILFGQAQGPFGPIDPQTVNWETYVLMGDIFSRLPQLRLTQSFGDFSASLAAVRPVDYANDSRRGFDVTGRGQDSGMPELQGRLGFSWDDTGHYWFFEKSGSVGLSGRFARERFNAGTDAEEGVNSWTAALDAVVPIGPVTVAGEVYYGENTDNVYGLAGVTGSPIDNGFDPDDEISEIGGWASVGVRPHHRFYTSVIYGHIEPDRQAIQDNRVDNGFGILRNQSLTANAYFLLLPTVYVATEYVWLHTDYYTRPDPASLDGEVVDGTLHRVQAALHFTF